ncbi:MAG: hypothetical protein WA882_21760 [Geitlerinemataceae cyanobacterium]
MFVILELPLSRFVWTALFSLQSVMFINHRVRLAIRIDRSMEIKRITSLSQADSMLLDRDLLATIATDTEPSTPKSPADPNCTADYCGRAGEAAETRSLLNLSPISIASTLPLYC